MKLSTAFMGLPSTLLVASLSLAVVAAPTAATANPELRVLTPEDFDQTISEGVWFIEHFSPYCGHCRNFFPTWKQLVETTQNQTNPGIHLAQVNCAVNGDLCRTNGVTGYPQMNLYRNGEFVEMYNKPRSFELLTEYLSAHAEPIPEPEPIVEPTPEPEPEPEPVLVPALQINSPPAYRNVPARDLNPDGTVLSLNEEIFRKTVDAGSVFIKFFAPWCGHCKKLAPVWINLAKQMQHKVTIAEVNCEEYASLCQAEKVQGFPTLVYYGGSGSRADYASGRTLDQLKAFVDKVSGPAVQELRYEDLQSVLSDNSALYLLLHPPNAMHVVEDVIEASHALFGTPSVFESSSEMVYDYFSVNPGSTVILALKDHDSAPSSVYHFSNSNEALEDWLLANRFPSSMQLDSDNFQDIMKAPHKPLVILVATPTAHMSKIENQIAQIARQWKDAKEDPSVTFVYMDGEKWASWLKSMYGIKVEGSPRVVIANHSSLVYYDTDQYGQPIQLTAASIFSALHGALTSTIKSKHSENFVERMARYLNHKLTAIEIFVTTYPWRAFFMFVIALVGVAVALKRCIIDPAGREFGHYPRKTDRLD